MGSQVKPETESLVAKLVEVSVTDLLWEVKSSLHVVAAVLSAAASFRQAQVVALVALCGHKGA